MSLNTPGGGGKEGSHQRAPTDCVQGSLVIFRNSSVVIGCSPGNPGNSRSVLSTRALSPPAAGGVFKEIKTNHHHVFKYPRRRGEGGLSSESTDGLCPGFTCNF